MTSEVTKDDYLEVDEQLFTYVLLPGNGSFNDL